MGFDWGSHFWHSVFVWATGIAAVCGGIGVAAAFIAGMVGYQVTEFSLARGREAIATARVEADSKIALAREEAKVEVEKAHAEIAKANAQIEIAKKDAAEARLEQERLKSLVVWRSIPKDVGDRISERLSARKATVKLTVLANDPEGMAFASMLTRILVNAKWEALVEAASWVNWLPVGVSVYGPDETVVKFLLNAFRAEGVDFSDAKPLREPDLYARQEIGASPAATILVGVRLGPL